MPLCADVDRLSRGYDTGLTHMYDERQYEFKAPQVGSFLEVHAVEDEHGLSLVGTARVNRRNANVTDKIIEMYNNGRLKFSFEIWASEITEEDGVTVVDAAPGNRLTAMAIVTTPALPAAVAIGLAAEVDIEAFEHTVYEYLFKKYEDGCFRVVWLGLEYCVIYIDEKMIRIDYRMDDGNLIETDEYEVVFAREVNEEMDNIVETAEVTNVETPDVAEVAETADAVLNTDTVGEAVVEEVETTEEVAEVKDEDVCAEDTADEALKAEAEDLKRELEQIKAELEQYKAAEAEAKMAEKRAAARKYAEREHLNMEAESVKAAIENADYEALAAEVMAKPVENKNDETYRVVAEMKIESPYGNMFEKAN